MKRHTFCFLLMLPLAMLAQQPFAPIGAKWYDDFGFTWPDTNPTGFSILESTGDTTIGGFSLRKVDSYRPGQQGIDHSYFLHLDSGRVSFLQDDTLRLIYDFTITVGDSVTFDFNDSDSFRFGGTVVEDTQMIIDSIPLRKIVCRLVWADLFGYLDTSMYAYAERIGVLPESELTWSAVVPVGPFIFTVGPSSFPRCYQDEAISYTYASYATYNLPCDYTQPVSIEQPATESWRVYPNPSRGQVRVAAPSGATARAHEVQVWDAQGRMVLRRPMQGEETALSLTGHVPGLYVLQVRAEGQVLHSQRLVLQ